MIAITHQVLSEKGIVDKTLPDLHCLDKYQSEQEKDSRGCCWREWLLTGQKGKHPARSFLWSSLQALWVKVQCSPSIAGKWSLNMGPVSLLKDVRD